MRSDTCTKFLRYDFTAPEIQNMGQDLAKAYNLQRTIEEEEAAVKAQIKERKTKVEADIGRLSRLITAQFEMRNVDCTMHWHSPAPGFVTLVRTDTGECVEERQMTYEERQELLPFADKHSRQIPKPEAVRGALVAVGEDVALEEVAKFSDTELCLVLDWAIAFKKWIEAQNKAMTSGSEVQMPEVPDRPEVLTPVPSVEEVGQGLLNLVDIETRFEVVEKWSKAERIAALRWANALYHNEHLDEGQEAVNVPPRPEVLANYKRGNEPPKAAAAGE